ncbi:MAG: DNA polymerase III subunit epsilon [Legionellaceae bacterium]|nr:DNA polymerase III subunit epsilon [Legionellaceae bacterium]
MRQIVLDTETTGIGHELGHRVIEIGCVEMIDRTLTGKHYHVYINPEREVDDGAFKVHGISNGFLADKPVFSEIIDDFIRFVDGAELVIHNAPFDMGFLNAELKRCQWRRSLEQHCRVLDTLDLARKKHPGQRNSLDALCKRYDVDNSNRERHGALLDAEILAFVYLAMTGGQISMMDQLIETERHLGVQHEDNTLHLEEAILIEPTEEEQRQHQAFVTLLRDQSGHDYFSEYSE